MHLKVIDIKEINYNSFYVVKYGTGTAMVKMYPFQKGTSIPEYIQCCETKLADGKVRLVQDKHRLLESLYVEGKKYPFLIKDIQIDSKSRLPYLILEDKYGLTHRFYQPSTEARKMIGQEANCTIIGIDNSFLRLRNGAIRKRDEEDVYEKESEEELLALNEYSSYVIPHAQFHFNWKKLADWKYVSRLRIVMNYLLASRWPAFVTIR